ncbi:hypothetical protein JKF63_06654 [Porcisia hertigi]|uniref:J domain-containing protein n=1 Tax=Porcisia hertigi TaxID=2761500 RepID=A0A836LER7_9TRYP|nr:hypothetical protein JKF63_06654 [Porcisia hertigi]
MDRLAGSFLTNGDVANASSLYSSLAKLNPTKYSRMARICRVLLDPQEVPLPHRHRDICEALLDPLVPAEVLLRDTAENVHKSFQRLAVCVHPDKNPNRDANEAFLRLTEMKEKALALLSDAMERKREGEASTLPGKAPVSKGRKGKPHMQSTGLSMSPGGHGRRPLRPAAPSPAAAPAVSSDIDTVAAVSSNIAQLRSTKITLNALKRKNIADDFEIFSATHRNGVAQSKSGPIDEEDRHAATVTVMPPKGRPQRANQKRTQPNVPPKTANVPSKMSITSSSCPSSSLNDVTPVLSQTLVSSPPIGEGVAMDLQSSGLVSRDVPALSSPPVCAVSTVADSDAIRRQIDEACVLLQAVRLQRTTMRLNLDLSFEAYQRIKESQ